MRASDGVELVFEVPRWSDRWVLRDDVNMPESHPHERAATLLKQVLEARVASTGRDAMVGGNIALRWDEGHPQVGVDPDVFLVEPAPPDRDIRSLRTWVPGHSAPRVAIEIVSEDGGEKDYVDGPKRYAASGTRELWVFDPEGHGRAIVGGPLVLQVWRRLRSGAFRRVYAGDGPAYSDEVEAWLVVTDGGTRLRVADDEEGTRLWPTAAEAERQRAEAERQRAEAAVAREAVATKENEKLREEIERLKARG